MNAVPVKQTHRSRFVTKGLPPAVFVAALSMPAAVLAERWSVETSVQAQTTATSNAGFQNSGQKQGDVIVEVNPGLTFIGQGARLNVSGALSLGTFAYVRGTQSNKVTPIGSLLANLEAIERFLFIDTGATVRRVVTNPFGPRPDGASSVNSQTETTVRIAPRIDWNISPRLRMTARSENSWTRSTDAGVSLNNAYASRNTAALSLLPRPLGISVAYERSDSDFSSSSQPRATTEIGRVVGSYSIGDQVVVGVRGGHERNNFPGFSTERNFYGAEINWRPSDRTSFSASGEDRFFGTGWQAAFSHRMPRLAFDLQSSRDVTTFPQVLLTLPVAVSVASLLDQALTTRIPDPAERSRAVQDLIASRGLPPTLIAPIDFFTEQVSLRTAHSVNAVLLGARNSLGLTLFYLRTQSIVGGGSSPILPTSLSNNTELGGSLTFSHQLTSLTSLNATAAWSRTQGLGAFTDSATRQSSLRLQVNRSLAPKTAGFVGARYLVIDSNVTNDAREVAVFAGVSHRF